MARLSIGTIISRGDKERFAYLGDLGATSCQLSYGGGEADERHAARVCEAAAAAGVTISSVLAGWSGPSAWNFVDGPSTIGLVPPQYRKPRLAELKRSADFASLLGVKNIVSHIGFLPVNPKDPDYLGAVKALTELADHCAERGVWFCFETGQETPVVLRRCMADIGRENLGVNLDPANLLMYGNANPIDALDLLGPFVRDVHAKDGDYPTNGRELGPEKVLGEGRVNFPALVAKLKSFGYSGSLTIEREISGPQQIEDIKRAVALLTPLL